MGVWIKRTAKSRNTGWDIAAEKREMKRKPPALRRAWMPEKIWNGRSLRTEHIVQDEWIDFRRSVYRFPDGSMFEPYYSYSRRDYVVIAASDEEGIIFVSGSSGRGSERSRRNFRQGASNGRMERHTGQESARPPRRMR